MESTSVGFGGVALLFVGMLLLGGIVLVVIGLSNRHTRGATIAVSLIVGTLVVILVANRWLAVRSSTRVAQARNEQQVLDTQARHLAAVIDELNTRAHQAELEDSTEAQQLAAELRTQAEQLAAERNAQMRMASRGAPAPVAQSTFGRLLALSLVGLVGLAVIATLFKHAGPGVGFAVLAVPVVLFGFWGLSYQSMEMEYRPVATDRSSPMFTDEVAQEDWATEEHLQAYPGEIVVAANEPAPAVATDEAVDPLSGETGEQVSSDDPIASSPSAPKTALPGWVTHPPKSVENVHRVVVESSWFDSPQTCNDRVEEVIRQAVEKYLYDETMEFRRGYGLPPLERMGISNRYVRDNIVKERVYERRDFEHQADMANLHVLLEFDDQTTQDMLELWRNYARRENVMAMSLGLGGVLASLAGVLGLIKLDTYTKGYYTKRLFIGVPAAIIGIVLLLAILN